MALTEGQMLGAYRVMTPLGQGGMATIYKGYHARLDRHVAIKVLHPAFLQDDNFLARFEREAQIVARLEHPHIVPVYDFAEFEGQPYLVMKYIEGQTLKVMHERAPLVMADIERILPRIADALDYAHRHNVLHRDIKPSNILIDREGTPYITDFGLARMAQFNESTISADVLLGTPHYISPEQAMGRRDLDARTDIYSFGIVLYELITGRVPFSADTPYAVIHDHIYRALPMPSAINADITPEVEAVVLRMLAKNPTDRYASAGEAIAAFREAAHASGMIALNPQRRRNADDQRDAEPGQTDSPYAVRNTSASDEGGKTTPMPRPTNLSPDESVQRQSARPASRAPRGKLLEQQFLTPLPPVQPSITFPMDDIEEKPKHGTPRDPSPDRRLEAAFDFAEIGQKLKTTWGEIESNFTPDDFAPDDDDAALRRRVEKNLNKRKEFIGHLILYVLITGGMWLFSGAVNDISALFSDDPEMRMLFEIPWPLLVSLFWGAGLAGHAVTTYFETGARASRVERAVRQEFRSAYGADWSVRAPKAELKKIRRRVSEPFNKVNEFFSHLAVYIMVNLGLWVIFFGGILENFARFDADLGEMLAGADSFPFPLIVMLIWGVFLVGHGADTFGSFRKNRSLDKEVERERARLSGFDDGKRKRKNDDSYAFSGASHAADMSNAEPGIRLNADGEFTDSVIEEIEGRSRREGRR